MTCQWCASSGSSLINCERSLDKARSRHAMTVLPRNTISKTTIWINFWSTTMLRPSWRLRNTEPGIKSTCKTGRNTGSVRMRRVIRAKRTFGPWKSLFICASIAPNMPISVNSRNGSIKESKKRKTKKATICNCKNSTETLNYSISTKRTTKSIRPSASLNSIEAFIINKSLTMWPSRNRKSRKKSPNKIKCLTGHSGSWSL